MSDPVRLAKRVIELTGCSRLEAEQYIEGGWVRVDGELIDEPQFMVSGQQVELDANAQLAPTEPATLLLHKPSGFDSVDGPQPAAPLLNADSRWQDDPTGIRFLRRHFARQTAVMPLERDASGLLVYTQDGRLLRRIGEDADRIEQEFVVEVAGEIKPYGLRQLALGLHYQGRAPAPAKVSWQNETRLRFAMKGVRDGQITAMCAEVGLQVVSIKRLRIGRVSLAKMPIGQWRYLPGNERL
ncbi:rRNA pseudouridine synthase [Arenimonas oryziterrae]|uniref:Dual-specificity RNA pseudouridine synthase RluF n=1 Tax=Arenimonas oryziterrae DSM 21050 = YC6267 TaxID=1121015 RepID=A0A091ALH1_9GAMM|nr:rRNA pseudouridine synthase [Arenimonas oryziterrae]KFN41023.1 hypothetical protein N789_03835 [Arenimonas oryziterrae DSM 21050 = YC6267]